LQKKIIPYSNGKFATEIIRIVNKIHNNLIWPKIKFFLTSMAL
jgi:hypothetical protein